MAELVLTLDAKGFVTGAKLSEKEAAKLDKTLDKVGATGKKSGSTIKGMGATIKGAIAPIAAGAAAVTGFVAAATKLVNTAAAVEDSTDKFNTLFGGLSRNTREWTEEWAALVGVTERAAEDMLSNLGAISQGMGYSRTESAEFSKQILAVAGDLASFNDVSNERAASALASALTGEREALKGLGIVIHEADVQTRALANSGKENAKQLTQQEKAAATLELVMERAGEAMGDAARTSDSLTKELGRARAAWGDLFDDIAGATGGGAGRTGAGIMQGLASATRFLAESFGVIGTEAQIAEQELDDLYDSAKQLLKGGGGLEDYEAALAGLTARYDELGPEQEEERKRLFDMRVQMSMLVTQSKAKVEADKKAADAAAAHAAKVEEAEAWVKKFGGTVEELSRGQLPLMGAAAEKAAVATASSMKRLSYEFNEARNGFGLLHTELLEVPQTALPTILSESESTFSKIGDFFEGTAGKAALAFSSILRDGKLSFQGLVSAAASFIPTVGPIVSNLVSAFGNLFGKLTESARDWAKSVKHEFRSLSVETLTELRRMYGEAAKVHAKALQDHFRGLNSELQEIGRELAEAGVFGSGVFSGEEIINLTKKWIAAGNSIIEWRKAQAEGISEASEGVVEIIEETSEAARVAHEEAMARHRELRDTTTARLEAETAATEHLMALEEQGRINREKELQQLAESREKRYTMVLAAEKYNQQLALSVRLSEQAARIVESKWLNRKWALQRQAEDYNKKLALSQRLTARAGEALQSGILNRYHRLVAMTEAVTQNMRRQNELARKQQAFLAQLKWDQQINPYRGKKLSDRGAKEYALNKQRELYGDVLVNRDDLTVEAALAMAKRLHEARMQREGTSTTTSTTETTTSDSGSGEVADLLQQILNAITGGAIGQTAARQTADRVTIGAPAAGFGR